MIPGRSSLSVEAGDTLVEVLIAIVILSLTVTALLGALITCLTSSAEHRSLANIDTILKSYAENATYEIELQLSPVYAPCAAVVTSPQSATTYHGQAIPSPLLPSGWSPPYIVGIQFWNNASGSYDMPATCQTSDEEFLSLGVTAPDGVSETLTIGLRSPT